MASSKLTPWRRTFSASLAGSRPYSITPRTVSKAAYPAIACDCTRPRNPGNRGLHSLTLPRDQENEGVSAARTVANGQDAFIDVRMVEIRRAGRTSKGQSATAGWPNGTAGCRWTARLRASLNLRGTPGAEAPGLQGLPARRRWPASPTRGRGTRAVAGKRQ